jgi:putative DNA primase/helicase
MMGSGPYRATPSRTLIAPTLAEFEAMPIPPREFLLAPWLPRQGLTMLYGPRGGGKTWLAWSVAMAVASGSELFGKWRAPRPGRVVYVDGELPAGVIRDRMTTAKRGRTGGELAPDAIRIIAADMQPDGLRSLDSLEGQRDLDPYFDGADLVIFDNLSALTRCRENEADDWGPFQGYLLSLRRRGLSALLIHHAGKGGQQRGTSRREDVLDSVIALRKPQDHDARDGAAFQLHFEKARGFWGDDAAPFGLQFDVGGDGGACWTVTDIDAGEAQRSRARELKASGASLRDIAEALGIPKSTVHRWLAE